MVGPNKILTVSYGTFSCTLEGFDDPFSTMRGIAEYFRDLAADDRYFGAEPPTPDAEMLHRIAEKEIQRRVEARVGPNGIVLTQMDGHAEAEVQSKKKPSTEAADTEPEADLTSEVPVPAEPDIEEPDPFVDMVDTAATAPVRGGQETVAERLARIRAVVRQGTSDYNEDGENALPVQTAQAEHPRNDWEDAAAPETAADSDADEELQHVEDDAVEEAETLEAAVADEQADDMEDADDDVVAPDEDEDQRASEPEDAFLVMDAEDDDNLIEDDMPAVMAEEIDNDDLSGEDEQDEDAFDISALAAGLHSDEDSDEHELEAEPDDYEDAEIDLSRILAAGEDTASDREDDGFNDEMHVPATEPSGFAQLVEAESRAEQQDEPEADTAENEATVARLLKMRLSDFAKSTADHEAFVAGQAKFETTIYEEAEEQDAEAEAPFVLEDSVEPETLVLGDEEQVEDELFADDEDDERDAGEPEDEAFADEPEDEPVATAPRPVRPISRPENVKAEATSVSRLLQVTNSEMAEQETSRRRSAIAHLKAAVAATRADRAHSGEKDAATEAGEQMEPYRNDLARVVRPRRPEDGARQTPRRMPPLMLVSEQRVDVAQDDASATSSADIRPKRISRDAADHDDLDDDNIFSAQGSFEEFAREVGAVELTDLLEAAAAYYHYVEGQEHFSRPQIMKAVEDMNDTQEYSREERLRSFGMLLRRGKIRKIRRGQFEITDNTRFRPELRAGE